MTSWSVLLSLTWRQQLEPHKCITDTTSSLSTRLPKVQFTSVQYQTIHWSSTVSHAYWISCTNRKHNHMYSKHFPSTTTCVITPFPPPPVPSPLPQYFLCCDPFPTISCAVTTSTPLPVLSHSSPFHYACSVAALAFRGCCPSLVPGCHTCSKTCCQINSLSALCMGKLSQCF